VAPLFNYFNRIEGSLRSAYDGQTPQWQTQSRPGRMPQLEGIDSPGVGMIVIIRQEMASLLPCGLRRQKMEMVEMRVHHSALRVIGSRMDVLKRREQECKLKCQACRYGQCAAHQ
jgi:hypothetical protein